MLLFQTISLEEKKKKPHNVPGSNLHYPRQDLIPAAIWWCPLTSSELAGSTLHTLSGTHGNSIIHNACSHSLDAVNQVPLRPSINVSPRQEKPSLSPPRARDQTQTQGLMVTVELWPLSLASIQTHSFWASICPLTQGCGHRLSKPEIFPTEKDWLSHQNSSLTFLTRHSHQQPQFNSHLYYPRCLIGRFLNTEQFMCVSGFESRANIWYAVCEWCCQEG